MQLFSRKISLLFLVFMVTSLAYAQEYSGRLTPRNPLLLAFPKNSNHVVKTLSYDRHDMPCYSFWAKSGQIFSLKSLYDRDNNVRFAIFSPNFKYYHIKKENQPAFYQDIPEGKTLNVGGYMNPVKDFSSALPENGKYLLCPVIWKNTDEGFHLVERDPYVKFYIEISKNNLKSK